MKKILSYIFIFGTIVALSTEVYLLTQPREMPARAESHGAPTAEGDRVPIGGLLVPENFLNVGAPCVEKLKEHMVEEETKFGAFINAHFRSEKPASELIPTAIEKFREVRANARKYMKDNFAHDERGQCERALSEDLLIMKELLRQHIAENAYAKKTTMLLERYKAINEKLQKLNFTIAQFYGYFATFAQALPCYASQCVKG